MKKVYEIEIYENEKGKIPFFDWISNLKDLKARAKIQSKLNRIELVTLVIQSR